MTDRGPWPGEDTAETRVMGLSPEARRVLATLAVIGRASLSPAELEELVEAADVAPLIDDLERRGLIERDARGRYSVLERIGEPIRRADEAAASADRLLQYLGALARGGELTATRLAEDAGAILGLSEWAATTRRWATVLELVKAMQGCFRIANRVQDWLALLGQGRSAARALGDTRQEIWMLEQLASASSAAGDPDAARRYSREADQLARGDAPTAQRTLRQEASAATAGRSLPRLALWLGGVVVAGGVGVAAGYALGNGNGDVGVTTARVRVTATVRGRTTTATKSVTLPATTITSTATTTETTTVTTTVTTSAQIP